MSAGSPGSISTEPRNDGVGAAIQRLRSAQKSSKGAPPYSLLVNRPAGRVLAALAYVVGLRPNQVTVLSAAATGAAIVVLAAGQPTFLTGLLVSLLLALGYALDSADGQLARLRGGGSLTGEWLDHMIDSAKVIALHLAVLVLAARTFELPSPAWLLVPLVFAVVSGVHFFGMILVEQLQREHRAKNQLSAPAKQVGTSGWKTLAKAPTDYGVLCWVFVLLGIPVVFSAAYLILAVATTGYLILILRKWFGDVRELDRLEGRS